MTTALVRGEPLPEHPEWLGAGLVERVDDYCATAFMYCTTAQPVERYDAAVAMADLERTPMDGPVDPALLDADEPTRLRMVAAWERRLGFGA